VTTGGIIVLNDSMKAAADYKTKQWHFVRISGDRAVTVGVTTEGDAVYGVLTNKPETSEAATVAVLGVTRVVAAAEIDAGALVMATTAGQAKAAGTSKYAVGRAREAAVTNQELSVFLLTPAVTPA